MPANTGTAGAIHRVAELNSRCMALDVSQLPSFSTDAHGQAKGYSELEYAPWKVGRL
ncbi:hypothetical protein [Pseudomonas monteilii]|uniref:hypothetical protein n=1 Tax=Pseudomonas monteilii TaxID=76759 RepID=UPI001603D589|nr:hypothetical protein [Pseudomonas monteilii]